MKLVAEKLVIARGMRIVIDDVSFELAEGGAMVLTGPNGAGKTTLIRAIAGFLPLQAGAIHLEGGDTERDLPEQCHYVGHSNGVKSSLTVSENLVFWAAYLTPDETAAERSARVDRALETFNLLALEDIPGGYLSAGQKRRLGLARLLLAERPVWLLDEPTVSLDTASTALLASAVKSHTATGGLTIAATHLPLGFENPVELKLAPRHAFTSEAI